MQRINQSEPGLPIVSTSDRRFKFVDGRIDEAQKVVEQPITAGLLSGQSLSMRLIDRVGNGTCPLLSINEPRRLRMVIDYEEGHVMFKDNPEVWHKLPTTKKGLMMIPDQRGMRTTYRWGNNSNWERFNYDKLSVCDDFTATNAHHAKTTREA